MKIDFSTVLQTLTGVAFQIKETDKERDMTLADASVEALLAPSQDETGQQKFEAYQLAAKVNKAAEVELTPEEVAAIKSKIGAAYGPAVVGPAFTLLNG